MKKKFIAACALMLSTLAFTACGASNQKLTFDPNWRSNVLSETPAGTKETLTYEVKFEDHNTFLHKEYFTVAYCLTPGSYVTTLEYEGDDTYKYVTELSVPVQYKLVSDEAQTKTFTDYIKTETVFKKASDYLRPISSKKTAHCYSPNDYDATLMEHAYTEYHYEFFTEYTDSLSENKLTRTDFSEKRTLLPKNSYESAVSKTWFDVDQSKYTYLDNDQLLFALRGLSNTAIATSKTVNVYNASLLAMETVTTTPSESQKTAFTLSIDGGESKSYTIENTPITIKTGNKNAGISQTLYYAKTTSNTDNKYRNVLLKMVVPMHYGLGTLTHTLQKAEFSKQA